MRIPGGWKYDPVVYQRQYSSVRSPGWDRTGGLHHIDVQMLARKIFYATIDNGKEIWSGTFNSTSPLGTSLTGIGYFQILVMQTIASAI